MKKPNVMIANSRRNRALLRDSGKALKVKTSLKAGVQKVREA